MPPPPSLISYELIFVNDGSVDNTLEVLEKLAEIDPQIKVLDFSRNFGKEAGILAGLRESKGDFVVLIDADLQHPLELIFDMFKILRDEHSDVVYAKRRDRIGENKRESILKKIFYQIYGALTGIQLNDGVTDFCLMKREVVDSVLQLGEYHRFSKGIFEWVGFKRVGLEYENRVREQGRSGWGFWKLFKYALDGIFSFSSMPLRLAFVLGFLASVFALIYGVYILVDTLIFGNAVRGYPSLMCIITFFGGLQLIVLGIIGEYIARIYEQGKNRPHYILRKRRGNE